MGTKGLARLLVVVLVSAIPACADYGRGDPGDGGTDAGLDGMDARDGSAGDPDLDGPFCSGAAKVEIGQRRYAPVDVTSERLVMGCCDGAFLRFHIAEEEGFDALVTLQFYAASMTRGEYDLGGVEGMEAATVYTTGEPVEYQMLTGTLLIQGEDRADDPLRLTLCAEAEARDGVQGLRLWVEDFPVVPWDWWEAFSIYRLQDPDVTADEAAGMPLDALELHHDPLVDLGTLAYYDAGDHTLVFGGWRSAEYVRNQLPEVGVRGLPFAVVVHGEPIYLGAFYTVLSSIGFDHPVIIIDPPDSAYDRMVIERNYAAEPPPGTPDPRSDPRLFELLRAAGKMKP
jgi:hypothetical protein